MSRAGGRARGRQLQKEARSKREGKPYASPEQVARAAEVIGELLDARLPDTGEPTLEDQALGVVLLSRVFALKADQKRELLHLLEQVRPELARDREVARMLDLRRAQEKLQALVVAGRVRADDLPPGALDFEL